VITVTVCINVPNNIVSSGGSVTDIINVGGKGDIVT